MKPEPPKQESDPPRIVGIVAATLAGASVQATATLRVNLSVQHLLAAVRFACEVATIEQMHFGEPFGPFFDELFWFSSGCVFSSVAGIEAYVNEIFVDRAQHFKDLRPEVIDKLWELFERKKTLDKFDMALLLKQRAKLTRGTRPAQDVVALISLRDSLVHFKPEWANEQGTHARVAELLRNRFALSPFLSESESIFPRRWASRGCARWAVDSAVDFLLAFESSSGIPPKVSKFIHRLRS